MYAKIIALGLVGSALAITTARERLRDSSGDAATQSQLAPQTVGTWQQTTRWIYPSSMGQFQEYAQYAQGGLLATLSFDHNRLSAHNAVNCFLGRGEPIGSSTVRTLKTRDGSARFNVARFDEADSISLVVASQCLAQACIENPPAPAWADLGRLAFWKDSLFKPHYGAIPVNISMTVTGNAARQQPDYSAMEQALVDFVENLDMSPVRQQAQRETGKEP